MSFYKIPNRYRKNNAVMYPAYLRDYGHFFYANLDEPIDDADFANWVLSLYDKTGTEVAAGIGTLVKDIISGTEYRFYATFTIPVGIPKGVYQFVIYNSSTTDVKYQSNCVEVITEDDIADYVLLQFRNSSDIWNFNYDTITNYNTLFLPMNLVEQQPEIELKQYIEQSTGERRNQKTTTAKVLSLEGYFFDDGANDGMLALSIHDDIVINGKIVEVKTAYKIETNRINSVQKGVIELYDQEYSTVNLHG